MDGSIKLNQDMDVDQIETRYGWIKSNQIKDMDVDRIESRNAWIESQFKSHI
jgi:hypothetical protein